MPRVYLKREDRTIGRLDDLLVEYKAKKHLTDEELAKGLGMTRPTFDKRRKNLADLRLGELLSLRERLGFPDEEFVKCFMD